MLLTKGAPFSVCIFFSPPFLPIKVLKHLSHGNQKYVLFFFLSITIYSVRTNKLTCVFLLFRRGRAECGEGGNLIAVLSEGD